MRLTKLLQSLKAFSPTHTTEKRQNDSGQVITDIKFGFEAKVKET